MEGVQVIRADIEPIIHTLYESSTERYQYLVADPTTKDAIIIDPVLDRNPHAPGINTTAADQILYLVRQYKYHVVRILETHSIQEHPTSAWYLRTQLRDSNGQMPRICTGKAIAGVQRMFAKQYGVRDAGWAARFDSFRDGQVFAVGEMRVQCLQLLTQPDWFGFIIGHNVFLGKEIPKDLTESAAVRPTQQVPLRKLAKYANNHAFHPQKNEEPSRPSTAQTEVSEWQHEPVTPRASINMRRMIGRQHNNEDQNSISSRASSRQSNRRISQIPELA
ncbi:Putative ribonuclease Z/Hydroxyacylglutathione hydrolase [Septoria linicola]|uniref:Ribonuclease Z/Hydroxyacylglutathione hydrolase n=1 Tax=Septoria linicola TaxID=215465 RepID=A0A9Q9AXP4_9PEZI|nr:putative ribonuclease Z/Hydroxyacylglutathione hydrolase [Septoria linicola]USW57877.1 Putative ribonuclease Z/Hydroxyacylglutathione hydrolase [Septoria linicola]